MSEWDWPVTSINEKRLYLLALLSAVQPEHSKVYSQLPHCSATANLTQVCGQWGIHVFCT